MRVKLAITLLPEASADLKARAKRMGVPQSAVIEELLRWSARFEMGEADFAAWKAGGMRPPDPSIAPPVPVAWPDDGSGTLPPPREKTLRDPLAYSSPAWAQVLGARAAAKEALTPEQQSNLKDWMIGAWAPFIVPEWWKDELAGRNAPGPPAAPAPAAPQEPELPAPGPPPAAAVPGDLTAGMGDDVKPFDPHDPNWKPPDPFVPKPAVREWTDKDAPTWVAKVGEAIADGDARAEGEPLKALIRWRRGEEVEAPEGWA